MEEKKEDEDEKDKKSNLPGAAPRPIGTQERIVPLASHQTSRIPELAREALSVRFFPFLPLCLFFFFFPPFCPIWPIHPVHVDSDVSNALQGAVLSRVTRLSHPTVLQRGPEKLTYGTGVPAPWNNPDKCLRLCLTPSAAMGKELLANGLTNGKGKEERRGRSSQMHVSSRRGNTNRRVSGTLSRFLAAQGKGACIQAWLSRMFQGGQGVRAEQGRNVMFFRWLSICIRDPYLLHCHCFQTCFLVA
jgi:hypothetical protein